MGRLIVLAFAHPLYALIFFFALTIHFAGAQPLTFEDQRSQVVSSSHFVYISRLQLHPNPVAPGFWVEAPLSFRHWLLIPGTDRQKWLFQNPREADFPRSVAFDPRRGFYLGFTGDSSIVRSRDGKNWQTIVRGPQLVKSLVCKGRCSGTGCAGDLRELCSANVKDFFAQSKPRFAALTHRGDRFIGIISPEDDFDPYIITGASHKTMSALHRSGETAMRFRAMMRYAHQAVKPSSLSTRQNFEKG